MIKNLEFKKGVTVLAFFVSALVFILMFGLLFNFVIGNAGDVGLEVEDSINESYQNMLASRGQINETSYKIQTALKAISEAPNTASVAWNGLKGVLTLVLLPLDMINPILGLFDYSLTITSQFTHIPPDIIITITIILLVLFVFAMIRFVMNRGNDA